MSFYPVFLSVVLVVRNEGHRLSDILDNIGKRISGYTLDYELIVIDNASDDESLKNYKLLTTSDGLDNLQVYALTKQVNNDTAAWVGLENALGDFVAVINPLSDDIEFLPKMLEEAVNGADVVFANNIKKSPKGLIYRVANDTFHSIYKALNGINLSREAPSYRVLSKKVINFILQHPQPAISYRHLPATGGFSKVNMEYSVEPKEITINHLGESIERGMQLIVSTTRAPMRLVTGLSLFGAAANMIYSCYVMAVGLFKSDVAPGWVSLSLQQSGMFFLISLVLLVLGEYILHMASLTNEGPAYHVGQEFTSVRLTRNKKLNIEYVSTTSQSEAYKDINSGGFK